MELDIGRDRALTHVEYLIATASTRSESAADLRAILEMAARIAPLDELLHLSCAMVSYRRRDWLYDWRPDNPARAAAQPDASHPQTAVRVRRARAAAKRGR